MKTLFNDADRSLLMQRLDRLSPAHVPRWGRMDCAQMLAHLTEGLRMSIGDLTTTPTDGPLRFAPIRHAIIHWLPFPKGAPTAPELLGRRAVDHTSEVRELKGLIDRFAARAGTSSWPAHPVFGQLSERDWGVLVHRHLDHHLRQFGV